MFWHQSVCLSTLVGGGTPSQVWLGVYPIPGLARGYPIPGLDGVPPPPDLGWGTPRPGTGYPPGLGMGSPLDLRQVPPLDLGQGTPPRPGMGYLPGPGTGSPPRPGMGYPPSQHSEHLLRGRRYASCVLAGGVSCFSHCFSEWLSLQKVDNQRNFRILLSTAKRSYYTQGLVFSITTKWHGSPLWNPQRIVIDWIHFHTLFSPFCSTA